MKPISLDEFAKFAKEFNVIPVAESFLADSETPLTIYAKLAPPCSADSRRNVLVLCCANLA